ncbi:MAG: protein kinase [Myxococcota bacterium]
MKVCPRCALKYPNDNNVCFVDGATLEEAKDERLGTVLNGRYLIEAPLGEGGMAIVYRGRHTLVDRPVAIKIMNAEMARNPSMRERFRREAKNAASVQHPHIIQIDDFGETEDGTCFMVMELLNGLALTDLIERGPMPPSEVALLGVQIAQGLARAHDFDVIHRDLKPDNIFVCNPDNAPLVKIVDFGIARSMHDPRLTNAGEIFGTPQYLAPERITSIDAGPSADLYALGTIFFEMLTGQTPFDADDIPSFFIKHMKETPPRPSALAPQCPRRLEELILGLLEKKPEDRPVDAHQVIRELSALAPKDSPRSVPPPPIGPAAQKSSPAPTLPPTTLESWAKRAVLFDQMLRRVYPSGAAPPPMRSALEEIRSTLADIHNLRSQGLRAQRELEAMEQNAREGRERLGNAVQTLGEDLSNARAAARSAVTEVQPYFDADAQAEQSYRRRHAALDALGGYSEMNEPRADLVGALRETVDALDRWVMSRGAADKARRWIDAKQSDVSDLEFQIKALRQQLQRVEEQYEVDRAANESALRENGKTVETLEAKLLELASRFCDPLRSRRDLGDLFAQLEMAPVQA